MSAQGHPQSAYSNEVFFIHYNCHYY